MAENGSSPATNVAPQQIPPVPDWKNLAKRWEELGFQFSYEPEVRLTEPNCKAEYALLCDAIAQSPSCRLPPHVAEAAKTVRQMTSQDRQWRYEEITPHCFTVSFWAEEQDRKATKQAEIGSPTSAVTTSAGIANNQPPNVNPSPLTNPAERPAETHLPPVETTIGQLNLPATGIVLVMGRHGITSSVKKLVGLAIAQLPKSRIKFTTPMKTALAALQHSPFEFLKCPGRGYYLTDRGTAAYELLRQAEGQKQKSGQSRG